MVTSPQKPFLHVKEAAHELDVHPNLIRRAIRSGELAAVRIGPSGHYRIRRQALEEYLQPVIRHERSEQT